MTGDRIIFSLRRCFQMSSEFVILVVITVALAAGPIQAASDRGSLTLGRHYTSQQQGDATLLIEHSTNNLEQVGFDNTMSRYKIDGDETWLFYDQPNFEGLLFTATGPIGWTRVNPRYNDKVSSVKSAGQVTSATSATTATITPEPVTSEKEPTDQIFNAQKDVEYQLKKQLEVGDVIRAWGVYKDHTTSKFSVNIRGSSKLYLLHVDFRPYNNVVVLNNHVNGWISEIRPWFSRDNFAANKIFEVRIEVHEEEYRIFFNGNELRSRFPHRVDLSNANHVTLHGGSNGFKWTALKLPNTRVTGSGIPFSTSTREKNYLDTPLAVGDVITAWGIYATGSVKFNVNLMMENEQYFMIHVDFRPPPNENKVVLNSMKQNGWETEIRTTLPVFENGKAFKVDIKCLDGEFEIYHDGNVLGSKFPYRDGFALEDVKFVWLLGGSRGMQWTDLAVSQPRQNLLLVGAEQSSVGWEGVPERAIDGRTDGNYWRKSCMHSRQSKNNWWMGTLAEKSAVNRVVIHNRVDCCYQRIDGAKVYVGDVFCGEVKYEVGKVVYDVPCGDAVGGTVKVVQNDQYLTLCEVQVFGRSSGETPLINIATGSQTWQNSAGWSGVSSRATDGRSNGNYRDQSCSHTNSTVSNTWKVDLVQDYWINRVVIHNRIDCCRDRIDGVEVFVDGEFCGAVEYLAGQNVYVVDCADKVGSEIKLTQQNNYLTLCEVEVLGIAAEQQPTSASSEPGVITRRTTTEGSTTQKTTSTATSTTQVVPTEDQITVRSKTPDGKLTDEMVTDKKVTTSPAQSTTEMANTTPPENETPADFTIVGPTELHLCKDDEFTCKERCISLSWRCDGERDCLGGEDEENCGSSCKGNNCTVSSEDLAFEMEQKLVADNKETQLIFEENGNLILYCENGDMIWQSETKNSVAENILIIQTDGNMVIYGDKDKEIIDWQSGSGRPQNEENGNLQLVARDDNNLVLIDSSGQILWETNTADKCKESKIR